MKKKMLSLLLVLCMLLNFNIVVAEEVTDTSKDKVIWNVFSTDQYNAAGNVLLDGNVVTDKPATPHTYVKEKASISKKDTFRTADGQYTITASISGSICSIESIDAADAKEIVVPDMINFYFVNKIGSEKEGDFYTTVEVPADSRTGSLQMSFIYEDYELGLFHVATTVNSVSTAFSATNFASSSSDVRIVMTDNVKSIDAKGFINNKNIGSIESNSITDIGVSAFEGCTNLETIKFAKVKNIQKNCFKDCTSLANVNIGSYLQQMYEGAFQNCTSLREIDLTGGDSNSGLNTISTIPENCFNGCTNLANIKITDLLVNIGENAFYQCDMGEFKFENTKIQIIESNAFAGCKKLDYVLLPSTITKVGSKAFDACSMLRYVYCPVKTINNKDGIIVAESKWIQGKDTNGPVVSVYGTNNSLDGVEVFSPKTIVITDKIDVDCKSIVVTHEYNGSVTTYDDIFEKTTPEQSNVWVATFDMNDIGRNAFGTYTVTATDILGNESETVFYFNKNIIDKKAPIIVLDGQTMDNKSYGNVTIGFYDNETAIAGAYLNGEGVVSGTTIEVDGSYELSVIDVDGNTATKQFTVDTVKPVVKGLVANKYYANSPDIEVSDNSEELYRCYLKGSDDVEIEYMSGDPIVRSDVYELVVIDNAGNETKIPFVYDSLNPIIRATSNGTIVQNKAVVNHNVDVSYETVSGISSLKLTKDGITTDLSEDITRFTENGQYKISIVNRVGKKSELSFTIDKGIAGDNTNNNTGNNNNVGNTGVKGDADGDGSITLSDAQKTLKVALKIEKIDDGIFKLLDTDGNNTVDLADAQKILKVALKIEKF